ncbi:major capsid protein [Microviridae sp.]|nr:major capsid protein [Microviridae sp.]UOF82358.1 major capsid protein [Microviridae sp.]
MAEGHKVTIGGERLGSGKKMQAEMHGYNRSTHDLSYIWKSTMASGTLVPFMSELALPGDTFDLELEADVMTNPTIGPLFGNYKLQLDVYMIPIRLYQGKLHMNMLNIGMDMSKVPLPQFVLKGDRVDILKNPDNQQVNPSSILSYLGVRGVAGYGALVGGEPMDRMERNFNAIPYLGYWDIYKQYYANKQEKIGAVIHSRVNPDPIVVNEGQMYTDGDPTELTLDPTIPYTSLDIILNSGSQFIITTITGLTSQANPSQIEFLTEVNTDEFEWFRGDQLFGTWNVIDTEWIGSNPINTGIFKIAGFRVLDIAVDPDNPITIETFDLENIDTMRQNLLSHFADTPYLIDNATNAPYGLPFEEYEYTTGKTRTSVQWNQEGLALKTYQSDLFNNWLDTEWITGPDSIAEITAVDTSGGSFTIDELNLSSKIYNMLNRIAISGGTYDDWLDAVYTHWRTRQAENPIYMGGLIRNIVFQEVVSNAATENQPLGTLAGRGRIGSKNKGGKVIIKVDEPSYIMGIVSITPYLDYSQGNKWDMSLKTMNDLHKPALDEIGYQDLITDQMAWWDTQIVDSEVVTFKSAGKQPAWINYMTNYNRAYGNFADETQQMFMTLNRKYEMDVTGANNQPTIKDLTTYIDPSKFNSVYADTRLDAQNFWVQIGCGITARRKMSAKIIPNL